MALFLSYGQVGFWLAERAGTSNGIWIHLVPTVERAEELAAIVAFHSPDLPVCVFPPWDCLPYDRLSPSQSSLACRMRAFQTLQNHTPPNPQLVLITPEVMLQKIPSVLENQGPTYRQGDSINRQNFLEQLQHFGFHRQEVVREQGDFAVRGSLVDLFPAHQSKPIRLDFFGDTLESLKFFDPLTQRTQEPLTQLTIEQLSEVILTAEHIAGFQKNYRALFPQRNCLKDPLYQAISDGRTYPGMEHWAPLMTPRLQPFWDVFPPEKISFETAAYQALKRFSDQIQECYATRRSFYDQGDDTSYAPLPPEMLYVDLPVVSQRLESEIPIRDAIPTRDWKTPALSVPTLLSAWTTGGLERLKSWVEDQERSYSVVNSFQSFQKLEPHLYGIATLPLDQGFKDSTFTLITEVELFGQRTRLPLTRPRGNAQIFKELGAFECGDYIVHDDHGIGQYFGLEGVTVNGIVHDCLLIHYADGDKLYVPVENMNLVSRYGSAEQGASLDKLGLPQWQARKARVKNRIRAIATHLIQVAAQRAIQEGPPLHLPAKLESFSSQFAYAETDDQLQAIEETLLDLTGTQPMDRLVCGDVGFGKTEIALRAAFVTASSGYQVALVVPTTLLARQHFQTFVKRFDGTGFRVAQLSRLVPAKEQKNILSGLADGAIHIVIATHALLRKELSFHHLGLLIVDEEQHFGVAQKEKLKNLKKNIHVLTLSATPIPRTLQMALSGLRQMSLITTPPVGRLSVQTSLLPFDPVVVREAILREHNRGGQIFYVCPRLAHIEKMQKLLTDLVPEVRIATAHGQMPAKQLEKVMTDFENRSFDLLLSTNIVESGIDIATANTLCIHRSDLFGLAQLYQLRGRIGRGKTQGYAYFTIPVDHNISTTALRRLEVMQSLDYLGAGFAVASHDADIRGAGNLMGEEQTGHIREIGLELYQQMLQEAVDDLKEGSEKQTTPEWTPRIQFPFSLSFPESYIADLNLRLGLYRRLTDCSSLDMLVAFEAELIDRFGTFPPETSNLLLLMRFKISCQQAWIEKLDVGTKGAVITFYKNTFPNPSHLLQLLNTGQFECRLSPDHKIRFLEETQSKEGLRHLQKFLEALGAGVTVQNKTN